MTSAAGASQVFGAWCAVVGLLFGAFFSLQASGRGWAGLAVAAPLAAFLTGAVLWRLVAARATERRALRGALAGGLAGIAAHFLTWYLWYAGMSLCHLLTGGCTDSLGQPPAGPLVAIAGAAGLTGFSLVVCGWVTAPVGALLGWIYARRAAA